MKLPRADQVAAARTTPSKPSPVFCDKTPLTPDNLLNDDDLMPSADALRPATDLFQPPPPASTDDELTEEATIAALIGDDADSVLSGLRAHLALPGATLAPGPTVNGLLTRLVHLLQHGSVSAAARIACCPDLFERAQEIQRAANDGEDLMERHYAKMLRLARPVSRASAPSPGAVSAATLPFPYTGNYERLMSVESAVLGAAAAAAGCVDAPRLAFAGAGPLPLSGAMGACWLGGGALLVDVDASAVDLSRSVVKRWEAAGAVAEGAVKHMHADAAEVKWGGVRADTVLVASLVPDDAKVAVARALAGDQEGPAVFAVRSAHGLAAVANYIPAPRKRIEELLDFVGYVAPSRHMQGGVVVGEDKPPLAVFPPDVLNSIEIFVRRTEGGQLAAKVRQAIVAGVKAGAN